MSRWVWLVATLAGAAVVAYGVAFAVGIVAVVMGAAPLGLAGESTPTQPWVPPTVIVAASATFVAGARLAVRRFRSVGRRQGPLDQERPVTAAGGAAHD